MSYRTQGLHAERRYAGIYVRAKPLLHSLDVPYARLFCVLLWFRANKRPCESKLVWQQRITRMYVSSRTSTVLAYNT